MYNFIYSENNSTKDFINLLSETFEDANTTPFRIFLKQPTKDVGHDTRGLIVDYTLKSLKRGIDLGVDTLVTDFVLGPGDEYTDKVYEVKDFDAIKGKHVMEVYRDLRKILRKPIAQRALLFLVTHYRSAHENADKTIAVSS